MTEGQFCSAATIQMDVHCYGVITTATKDVEWIGETFGKNNPRIIKDFCGTKEASLEKYRSEEVNAVCESLRTKTPITVDLQSQPFEDPWVMEGCMYA
ncbi:hypothetical protein UVI_02029850 [Ustilaginoidea virens]|uniref:Uncharacterized protein n=1 Tax=Ustilaginoidea virens TaxID=1159556 RepID=A0A1B5L8F8_USTVR|nr:hypothetical protein UVI_02029850 [Ustilaginoidea virens]